MKTISEITKEQQAKTSEMFDRLGVFFAFSDQQFEKQKKEGVTYVQMYKGMIAPKENAKFIWEELDRIKIETRESYKRNVPMKDYILHELYNHECFYTGNYLEILEMVQNYYPECTDEDIRNVYFANINNND